jgi:NAD(P)-dependent dehydrogenase (short-subunit alcohol dehydrogenase family)
LPGSDHGCAIFGAYASPQVNDVDCFTIALESAHMPRAIIVGNSDGIGLALTELLLEEGWHVVGVSRGPSSVSHGAYQHQVLDVCQPDYALRLEEIVAAGGALDVLVYSVGIGEFLDLETLAAERQVFEANLIGAVATAQVILPHFSRAGRGHFIGLSSQGDGLVDPRAPSYAASKAGLSAYLEGLALAYRPRGIFVTNVRFGFVDTKMAKASHRPFMISRQEAAARVRRCLRTRPIVDTYPKRMAVLLWVLRCGRALRLGFSSMR